MVNIDPKRVMRDGREVWEVHINGGRVPTGLEAVAWAREVERLGAGEIVLTSMDADGTKNGYDLEMTRAVVEAVEIPVVASGGAGNPEHLRAVLAEAGASAALAASIFHYREYSIAATKEYLARHGVPVRLVVPSERAHAATGRDSRGRGQAGVMISQASRKGRCRPIENQAAAQNHRLSFRLCIPRSASHVDRRGNSVESITNEPEANKLFRMVMKYKGSDLHLKVGLAPSHAAGRRLAANAASAADAPPTWSG